MKISVLTSIVGGRDRLREDFIREEGVKWIAYTDQPSEFWEVRKPYDKFIDPVRNAKIHKVLSHIYDDGADVSVWLDGNIGLNVPVSQLVDEFLGDGDMWLMSHFSRKCLYDEAEERLTLEVDRDIHEQVHRYEREGMPRGYGLYECNVIIRKNSLRERMINETWWSEVCAGSRRDQLSFTYSLWMNSGMFKINTSEGNVREHPYFNYGSHAV